jgi:2-polyprenyl-3-methyl-5-hydroxy-6-metoxy-1,4-benzoquinol methylase
VPRFAAEAPWSRRLALRLLRGVPAAEETDLFGEVPRAGQARGSSPAVFVCADPEALVPPLVQQRLLEGLAESGFQLLAPVSNEAEFEEIRRAPAFAYATPTDLVEVAGLFASGGEGPRRVERLASPVYAVSRAALESLDPKVPLAEVPARLAEAGAAVGADFGAYVHRYGAMDASERGDLAARLPPGARRVLDVGCSQGASAEALRSAGAAEIWGIEPDAEDAARAARRYDRVLARPLEEVDEPWDGLFDAVLFGDVLEHLEDPARALVKVRPWLSERGRVVASVPNWGNAAVLRDLLEGRFDYIPYATLSGTHLRFFTRQSLTDLFEACGYRVEGIEGIEGTPTPSVHGFLEKARRLPGASPDLAVLEFLVVARPEPGRYDPAR